MNRVIFLDRDGTINVDYGFVHEIAKWQFTERAVQGLKLLQDAGFKLAIITNQSGIARKYYREADMHVVHEHLRQELANAGVTLSAIAFCPHDRDSTCVCRKPNTGMAKQIEKEIGAIDYERSWTIGDKEADLLFGKALGTKTALVQSAYWQPEKLQQQPDMIVTSLYEFATNVT